MKLYHATLPGQSIDATERTARGWFRAGWRQWDDLTGKEKAAHEAAVAAAAPDIDESLSAPDGDESADKE